MHLELLTQGSIKLVEKPLNVNLTGLGVQTMKSSLKVFSTEVGGIYGYLNYEKERAQQAMVVLNGIELDFMDQLHPGSCTESQFKKLWEDYEWENKINVNSKIALPAVYINALQRELNAKLVTPIFDEDAIFVAANLNAKSKFEEDCLINLSIELTRE